MEPVKWILLICTILLACRQNHRPIDSEESKPPTPVTRLRNNPDTPVRNKPIEDNLIIPGERIGRVYLGMENNMVVKLLGKPDSGDAAMGKAWLTWQGDRDEHNRATELNVFTSYADSTMRQQTVKLVQTTSSGFQTPAGIRVYASLADLQKVHANLKSVATYQAQDKRAFTLYTDKAQGIAYEVVEAGGQPVCTGIVIYPKGKNVLTNYRTRHPDLRVLKH